MRIVTVDPDDEPSFREWFAVRAAAAAPVGPDDPPLTYREALVAARDPAAAERHVHLVARSGSRALGSASVTLPLAGGDPLARIRIGVRPEARRRGLGSALLAAAEAWAVGAGYTGFRMWFEEPIRPSAPAVSPVEAGRPSPGGTTTVSPPTPAPASVSESAAISASVSAFAERHGYRCGLVAYRRDLTVPVDARRLARAAAAGRERAAGYVIRTWRGLCPDDLVAGRAALAQQMAVAEPDLTGEPSDGLDEPVEEPWDVERVRAEEARTVAEGRLVVAAGAVAAATGELVGITEIVVPLADPGRAEQRDTLVAAPHRGRRLSLLLKSANLRELAAASPATRRVTTWNAAGNAPMIAVNDALGCRLVGARTTWAKRFGGWGAPNQRRPDR